jgi:hypothetical protein
MASIFADPLVAGGLLKVETVGRAPGLIRGGANRKVS